jgi:hypothetical protein
MLQLNIAICLIGINNFQDALKKANQIWEEIKEGRESEVKNNHRNIMAKVLQRDGNYEAVEIFTEDNFVCYNNEIRTCILMIRQALHNNQF